MTYWEKRQQQLNKQMENDEEKLKKRLSSYYDAEYRKLEKEISSYFHKYGADNILEYRQLMQSLSDDDKKLLIERIDEFIGKYPEYEHLVPVRESIYKLNRLEGLQYSIRMQQYEIGAITNEELKKHLERQAMRGANAAAEAIGFGKNYYVNNTDITKMFVNIPWSNGKNFSQRIWENAEKLSNYLNTDVAQALARGDSYDKIVRNLRKRFMDVSKSDAYRLIYTEGTYVMAESSMYPFTEDFEKYRLSTVGDGKVCSICSGVAQEVFDIKDRKPGVNFPPLHPWCRCTFTIEVDDWDKWMDEYEKKHENGHSEIAVSRLKGDKENDILKVEYNELSLEEFKRKHHSVSKEERRILYGQSHFSGYINSSNARKMNGMLRRGEQLTAEYQEIADTLSNVIRRNTIDKDIVVTRYVTDDTLEFLTGVKIPSFKFGMDKEEFWKSIEEIPNLIKNGTTYTEKGFLSTSGVKDENVMQNKGVRLDIRVPKGTNCYITTNNKESEIIFGRNTTLKITNSRIENSRTASRKVVLECIIDSE